MEDLSGLKGGFMMISLTIDCLTANGLLPVREEPNKMPGRLQEYMWNCKDCGTSINRESMRITTVPVTSKFLSQLDECSDQLVKVFINKGGAAGKEIRSTIAVMNKSSDIAEAKKEIAKTSHIPGITPFLCPVFCSGSDDDSPVVRLTKACDTHKPKWACLIGNIYHHQAAPPGSPDHGAVALGRRMPQRNICQSETRGGFAEFPSAINRRETHETYMLQSSPDGIVGHLLGFPHGNVASILKLLTVEHAPLQVPQDEDPSAYLLTTFAVIPHSAAQQSPETNPIKKPSARSQQGAELPFKPESRAVVSITLAASASLCSDPSSQKRTLTKDRKIKTMTLDSSQAALGIEVFWRLERTDFFIP
ncbi:hypothetical protein F7725_016519 [Dissostichus mawsoni]|uniref:Uncharacterized protein n=1 Tax=Dissostichus mawsoni TaxID=36200 RepID=A0A7J5Z2I4_DISMA|nr:hypothetical protein F7725_016519 [Dissostichus mawsoni]